VRVERLDAATLSPSELAALTTFHTGGALERRDAADTLGFNYPDTRAWENTR